MLRVLVPLMLAFLSRGERLGTARVRDGGSGPQRILESGVEWRSKSLDELIAALPDVDQERWRSSEGDRILTHPAVTELRRRMDKGTRLSNEQWQRALIGSGVIRWRSAWPEDEPFAISLRQSGWADIPRIRVIPRHPELVEATCGLHFAMCGLAFDHDAQRAVHSQLGRLAVGHHALEFDIVVEARGEELRGGGHGSSWEGSFSLEVEIVPDLDDVLPPTSAPEFHAALRNLLRLERVRADGSRAVLFLDKDPDSRKILAEVSLALEAELLHAGAVVETRPPTEPERTWLRLTDQTLPPELHHLALFERFPAPDQDLTSWSLRLRGVEREALRWWGTKQRFAGVLEIPLAELLGP